MVDGYPRSWRHYVYGVAAVQRARAKESLRIAAAVRAGGAKGEDFKTWTREMQKETR